MKVEFILNLLVLLLFNVHYSHQFWNLRIRRPSVNVNTISTSHNHVRGRLKIPPTVYRNRFSLPSSNHRFPRPFGFGRTTQNTYNFRTIPVPKIKLPTFTRSNVPLSTNIRYQRPYVYRRPFHHIRFPILKRPIIPHLRFPHISNITHSWPFPLGIPPTIHSRVDRPEIIHPPIFKPPIVATYPKRGSPPIKPQVFTISVNILRHGKPINSQPMKPTTPKVENPKPDVVTQPTSIRHGKPPTSQPIKLTSLKAEKPKPDVVTQPISTFGSPNHTHSIVEKSSTIPSSIVEEGKKSTTTSTTPKLFNRHADVGKITTSTTSTIDKYVNNILNGGKITTATTTTEKFSTMSSTTEKYSKKFFVGGKSTITASSTDDDNNKNSGVTKTATNSTTEKNLSTTTVSHTKNDASTTKTDLNEGTNLNKTTINVSTTGKFNKDLNIHQASTTLLYDYIDIVEDLEIPQDTTTSTTEKYSN